jgi:hypothetical protein
VILPHPFPSSHPIHLGINNFPSTFLIAMNKTRDNEYLFAKMSISMDENEVGSILVDSEKNSQIPSTRAFNFEPEPKHVDECSVVKWLKDNVMLLVTLIGVLVGVVVGEYCAVKNTVCGRMKLSQITLNCNSVLCVNY